MRRRVEVEIDEMGEQAIVEERIGEAFAGTEQFTVVGNPLQPGEAAPDFCLDYLDLTDRTVHSVGLTDSAGMVRLLSVVNTLANPICQHVTRKWEVLCAALPPEACMYTVSMDVPQMQAQWQDAAGVIHQALSASRSAEFGQKYGVWLKEWNMLQMAVFIIDRSDHIVYTEYIDDQRQEPDYGAAMKAVHQAVLTG